MYQVKLYKDHTDDKGIVIHSPYINDLKLSSGTIDYVLGSIDDFTFSINLKNPAWNKVNPYTSLVEVKDVMVNKVIFEGRTLQPKTKMDSGGMFTRQVICESALAYLVDSSQRHAEIRDTTIEGFLQIIVDNHNKQVEPHKQFKVGNVTVTNSTDNVYRYLGYDNTYETIKDKLTKRLGGYIQARRESDGLYLDYLEEAGEYIKSTPIRLSHNMQSIDYEVDPTEVVTRLVPLGERIDSENEDATDASQARLTIADANNGIDYIDDVELQKVFGIIEKSETWNDVTQPGRLKTNGLNFLRDQKAAIARFNVDSINSHLLGKDIASFELGNYHDLINPVIGLNEMVQIIEKKININQPQKSSLKIGDKFRTLTEYQKGMKDTQKEVIELKDTVSGQTKRISKLSDASQKAQEEIQILHDLIDNIDMENVDETLDLIVQQLITISESINNIGYEVTDLELRTILLEDFRSDQGQQNNDVNLLMDQQEQINADVQRRLLDLEG